MPSKYYCTGWTEKRTKAPTRRSAKVSGTTKEAPLFNQKMLFFLAEALRLERCPPGRRGNMDNRHNYRAEGAWNVWVSTEV